MELSIQDKNNLKDLIQKMLINEYKLIQTYRLGYGDKITKSKTYKITNVCLYEPILAICESSSQDGSKSVCEISLFDNTSLKFDISDATRQTINKYLDIEC